MKKQLTPKTDAHFHGPGHVRLFYWRHLLQTYAHMQPGNTHSTPCTKKCTLLKDIEIHVLKSYVEYVIMEHFDEVCEYLF